MKKLNAGDRCEVESQGAWIPATILTVYPGHSGAMVLPDNWATSVWAKVSQIREITVNPSSAKRGDYLMGQAVEVQRAIGRWVEGLFDRWEDDTHERAYVATGAFEPERFHYTNIRRPRTQPDPHHPAYQGEIGDHQPLKHEYPGVRIADIHLNPEAYDFKAFMERVRENELRPAKLSPVGINPAPKDLAEALNDLRKATTADLNSTPSNIAEQIGYVQAVTEFAKAGITPEQLSDYATEFARTIAMGIQPAELHQCTTDHRRRRAGHPTGKLNHISNTYRGH